MRKKDKPKRHQAPFYYPGVRGYSSGPATGAPPPVVPEHWRAKPKPEAESEKKPA